MKETQVGTITIKDCNGTYLVDGSILPVFIDEEMSLYAREHYDSGDDPCDHPLEDLKADGVEFDLQLMGAEVAK